MTKLELEEKILKLEAKNEELTKINDILIKKLRSDENKIDELSRKVKLIEISMNLELNDINNRNTKINKWANDISGKDGNRLLLINRKYYHYD